MNISLSQHTYHYHQDLLDEDIAPSPKCLGSGPAPRIPLPSDPPHAGAAIEGTSFSDGALPKVGRIECRLLGHAVRLRGLDAPRHRAGTTDHSPTLVGGGAPGSRPGAASSGRRYDDPEQALHNPRMQSLHAAVGRVPVPVDRR